MSQLSERKAAWETKAVAKTLARAPERQRQFETSSGIPVERLYTPEDCRRVTQSRCVPGAARLPRRVPLHPRRAADHVPRPLLDDAPVCRLRHRRREQPALPLPAGAGPDRPERGLRPADADRLRRGRPAGAGRGGQGRRGDLLAGRHGDAARRHPAGQGQHQHDHQRAGGDPAGDGHRGGEEAGRGRTASCAARSRTTSSRSTSRAAPTSSRPRPRCA